MEKFVNIFVIIILLSILYIYFESKSYDVVFVKSNIDNNEYLVRNLPDRQAAANLLAKIRLKLVKLARHLKNNNTSTLAKNFLPNYSKDNSDEQINKLEKDIKRIDNNFYPDNLSESTPNNKYTSYSVNKGEKIVFCLRSKDDNERLVKENVMMFVALHELAHVMTKSVGHTPEFWDNFRFLLKVAIDQKLYKNIDFNSNPESYCGTKITDTPLKG